jgi:mRNA interferase MazF
VLVEQTAAVDPERLGHLIGHLTHPEMASVDEALRVVFQLP